MREGTSRLAGRAGILKREPKALFRGCFAQAPKGLLQKPNP